MPDPYAVAAGLLTERVEQVRAQQAALVTAIEDMRVARSLTFADDEHDPEGSMVSLDQARDTALLDQTRRTLAELEAARQRLVDGTYGVCEACGGEIPAERLAARPEARLCRPCSSRTARRR